MGQPVQLFLSVWCVRTLSQERHISHPQEWSASPSPSHLGLPQYSIRGLPLGYQEEGTSGADMELGHGFDLSGWCVVQTVFSLQRTGEVNWLFFFADQGTRPDVSWIR